MRIMDFSNDYIAQKKLEVEKTTKTEEKHGDNPDPTVCDTIGTEVEQVEVDTCQSEEEQPKAKAKRKKKEEQVQD